MINKNIMSIYKNKIENENFNKVIVSYKKILLEIMKKNSTENDSISVFTFDSLSNDQNIK